MISRRVAARWAVFSLFTLATALNYLDRQVLAAVAPQVREEFQLSHAQYGLLLSAFSLAYAIASPFAGILIDRAGLTPGITLSVALWSVVGISTGFAGGFASLLAMRALLGLAESGGIPASGKANALYLPASERALGAAVNQVGLSLGAAGAPLLTAWLALRYGWRAAFVVTGLVGFIWIPLWLRAARAIPPEAPVSHERAGSFAKLIEDRRMWSLVAANVLSMILYSLWTNWTTIYLVTERGLSQTQANQRLAWIPPVFANLGGLFGGWMALSQMRVGVAAATARWRVCLWSAVVLLFTGAIPWLPSAGLATAGICLSFFWTTSMSVNVYAWPLDFYGAERAAFAISLLTCSYGVTQALISPVIGGVIDTYGFGPVCVAGALLPLAAAATLRLAVRR